MLSSTEILKQLNGHLTQYYRIIADWVNSNWFELLLAVTAAVIIYLALRWLRRRAARYAMASERRSTMASIIARTLSRTSRFFRVMLAIIVVSGFVTVPAPVAHGIQLLFTIAVVWQIALWVREIVIGLIERRAGDGGNGPDTLTSAMVLIRWLVSSAVFAVAAIVILDNLNINVTGLVAGLGVGGIAIGLAAQGIFADLFAAISIIFDKPFRPGDVISYETTTATVEQIGMKSTRLRALSGEEKIISNSKLLEYEITNFTLLTYRRTTFVLGLVYHTPVEKIAALPMQLQHIVEENGGQFVRSGFIGFNASALDVQLVFDIECSDYNQVFVGRHNIGMAILKLFQREAIDIAYPTQTTYTAAPGGAMVMPYAQGMIPPVPVKK